MAQYNRFMGEYDDNTNYEKGDVVTFDGAAWYRKMPGSGISPIARKKPYTVWSRLNQNLSTIFPLGGGSGGGGSGGLPTGGGANQYMVTDSEGNTGWADRLAWKEEELVTLVDDVELDFTNSPQLENPFMVDVAAGDNVIVTINGTERYECVVQEMSAAGMTVLYFGNGTMGGMPTGGNEPFMVMRVASMNMTAIAYEEPEKITLRIDSKSVMVSPIAEEFLPKTVPLIEVESTIVMEEQVIEEFAAEDDNHFPKAQIEDAQFQVIPVLNETYLVCFDGIEYEFECGILNTQRYIGMPMLINNRPGNELVGENDFCFIGSGSSWILRVASNEPHTVSIKHIRKGINYDAIPDVVTFVYDDARNEITCSHSGIELFLLTQNDKKYMKTRFALKGPARESFDVTRYSGLGLSTQILTCEFLFLVATVEYGITLFEVKVEVNSKTNYTTTITYKEATIPIPAAEATT